MLKTRLFALALAAIMIFAVSVFASGDSDSELTKTIYNFDDTEILRTVCPGHEFPSDSFVEESFVSEVVDHGSYHSTWTRTGYLVCSNCGVHVPATRYNIVSHTYMYGYCTVCSHPKDI